MKKKKLILNKCPKCGKDGFIISVFGAICRDCFYEEKNPLPSNPE